MNEPVDERGLVLFLGAGASSWAGYRTFLNFPSMFWPSGNDPSELKVTDKERTLLNEVRGHLGKRRLPSTLDSYLRAIDEFQTFTSNSVSRTILRERVLTSSVQWASVQELRRLLMTIRDRICFLTAQHYRRPPAKDRCDRVSVVQQFFKSLLGLSLGRLSVFTTNYDILPEYLFDDHPHFRAGRGNLDSPLTLDNGFPPLCSESCQRNSGVKCLFGDRSDQCTRRMRERDPQGRPVLTWHRLHGCVAWLRGRIGDDKIRFTVQDPTEIESFSKKLCVSYPGHDEAYGTDPHAAAFRALAQAVSGAKLIVVIGFAFRDPDVMSVIGRSLDEADRFYHALPKMVVFDPHLASREVRERVSASLKNMAHPCVSWDHLLIDIFPLAFPDAGVLERIKKSWTDG